MISTSTAVVERGGVLRSVQSRPPLTIRQLRGEPSELCQLCLVGSAAGPLPGDRVGLQLRLGIRARARLTSTGASLAQGNGGYGRLSSYVELAEDAELIAEPAPVIACAGSSVEVRLDLRLAATSTIRWRELLVLGRHDEPAGSAVLDWRMDRAGWPVLRQRLELADPALLSWPGLLAGGRVLAAALISGPEIAARTIVDSPTAVCQPIDPHTALLTVLDTEAALAEPRLDQLQKQLLDRQ
jgi:urease accessory protein